MPSASKLFAKDKENDIISSECEDGGQKHKQWMTKLESTGLESTPLYNLIIPGSHDSGAYKLYPKMGFAVDRPDLQQNWFLNAFHFFIYPLIERYSITQRQSVLDQLKAGIRYLDIRVALRPEDGGFYICHNFYGPKLSEILAQISAFVADNPREVLILDFQHVHNLCTEEDHRRLYDLVTNFLQSKLVPTSLAQQDQPISLKSLWKSEKQVLIFYRHSFQRDCSEYLWPAEQLPNPWANTRDPAELKHFLETNKRPPGKLFVTQGVLTPNTSYVVRNLFGTLESKLTMRANPILYDLIVRKRCGWRDTSGNEPPTVGPNIVMFDFIDWKKFLLSDSLVNLNRALLTNGQFSP